MQQGYATPAADEPQDDVTTENTEVVATNEDTSVEGDGYDVVEDASEEAPADNVADRLGGI